MAWGYEREYFVMKQRGWTISAEAVVPVMLGLFPIRSAVEVGCGTANLLEVLTRHGVTDVLGLDGPDVPRDLLRIPAEQVRTWDLARLAPLERRFDLACTLEVAEHQPPESAEDFVRLLVAAAPVVLFSAAIPGQGGPGHLNERRQSWWARLFARHGYVAVDCIRPAIWETPGLEWYYAQNIVVYCLPELVPPGHAPVRFPLQLDLVHDRVFEPLVRGPDSISSSVRAIGRDLGALTRAVARRARRGGARPPAVATTSAAAPAQPGAS
jgi:SAM-dependent methyltransferase